MRADAAAGQEVDVLPWLAGSFGADVVALGLALVKGQRDFLLGGRQISLSADT